MATRSNIGLLNEDTGKIEGIYVHWDGYPSGVGQTLHNHYQDLTKVEDLIDLGNVSSLDNEITKPQGHSYDNRIKGYTTFFGRDMGREGEHAITYNNREEFLQNGQEYVYYFDPEENKWFWDSVWEPQGWQDLSTTDFSQYAKGGSLDYEFGHRGLGELREELIELGDEDFVESQEKKSSSDDGLYYAYFDRLTEYHGKYAKGGKVSKMDIEFTVQQGDKEWFDKWGRPEIELIYNDNEVEVIEAYYGGEVDGDTINGWRIKKPYGEDIIITDVRNVERRDYAKGGIPSTDNFNIKVEEPYSKWGEQKDFLNFKYIPKGAPITMEKVEGFITEQEQEIFIQFSNGDMINYSYYQPTFPVGAEEGYNCTMLINSKTYQVSESTLMEYLGGGMGSIVGDLGLMYERIGHKKGYNYAKGGSVGKKTYELKSWYVDVYEDIYEEGEGDYAHNWDNSVDGSGGQEFSSKEGLEDEIVEIIENNVNGVKVEKKWFDIDEDINGDGTIRISYSVNATYDDNYYGRYDIPTKEEEENWKKGKQKMFVVHFAFNVEVYTIHTEKKYVDVSVKKKQDYAKGGTIKAISHNFYPDGIEYHGDSERGYSVLIKDKNSDFESWVDITINNEYKDVDSYWNQYIFHTDDPKDVKKSQLQEDNNIWDQASSEAILYLERKGEIYQNEDGEWFYSDDYEKGYAKGGKIKKVNQEDNTALIGGGLMGILLGMFYR